MPLLIWQLHALARLAASATVLRAVALVVVLALAGVLVPSSSALAQSATDAATPLEAATAPDGEGLPTLQGQIDARAAAEAAGDPSATVLPAGEAPGWLDQKLRQSAEGAIDWFANLDPRVFAYIAFISIAGMGLRRFLRTDLAKRLGRMLAEDVITNWRLVLLGLTGILLSLASGYTTWDGMTNFTCPARSVAEGGTCLGPMILSGLITFGIQGVMLIAAWLIGESFARGMTSTGENQDGLTQRIAGGLVYVPLVAMVILTLFVVGSLLLSGDANSLARGYSGFFQGSGGSLTTAFLAFVVLALILYAVSQRSIVEPYVQGFRIILSNLPVWVMFFACMATSVFFSFDSLFSTIFPAEERARAAELRTSNQIAGLAADAGAISQRRQVESIDRLFGSGEWQGYSDQIGAIVEIAREAPEEIEALRIKEMEDRQSVRAGLQERKASAVGQQSQLGNRKESLLETIGRLKEEVPPIAATVEEMKRKVFDFDKLIIGKKAEAEAERGGVGGTGKEGAGPEFAKRKKELADLGKLKAIEQATLDDFVAQLRTKRNAVATAESELAQIDGEIGKLRGEVEVAESQITLQSENAAGDATTRIDVTGGFASLDAAFAQFRQRPERATFDAIQQHCSVLLNVFDKVPRLKQRASDASVSCDPSEVAEQTARVFALDEGLAAFKDLCGKPDSLPQTGTDAVLEFGEKCVQVSGLAGEDTVALRNRLNGVALNRDDRAHRFVVTWNAFLDGNRLAYLALAIALAIDGLVFMSGLFGANAVRSRLADLPLGHGRSPSDLEADLDTALLPNLFANARLVLDCMRPITPVDGFTASVDLGQLDRGSAETVSRVLTRGSALGAVRQDLQNPDRFLVRGELLEYLSVVCKRELSRSEEVRRGAEMERVVAEQTRLEHGAVRSKARLVAEKAHELEPLLWSALLPYRYETAVLVQAYSRPISRSQDIGYAADIDLSEVRSHYAGIHRLLSGVLSAGSALDAVVRDSSGSERFLLRPEFMMCLGTLLERAKVEWKRADPADVLFQGSELNQLLLLAPPTASSRVPTLPAPGLTAALPDTRIGLADVPRILGNGEARHATGAATRDDAASLNDARFDYVAEHLHRLGISRKEADDFVDDEKEIRRHLENLRSRNDQREKIEEESQRLHGIIDDTHRWLAGQSSDEANPVLETVTQEIRKLVPGIVLKTVVANIEPAYTGATN